MSKHHHIDYIELSVTNLAEAKRFYGAAFGWTFKDYGPEYVGIQSSQGGEMGGFALVEKITRGGPLVVLYSDTLEASLEAVKGARGDIVLEPFSFPGGHRFHFLDPSGNELAVWSKVLSSDT
ncbi:MAG: VOC family protein [Myxococcales bacterium]|nr:VOC family protein [Myxococcales bacterium]